MPCGISSAHSVIAAALIQCCEVISLNPCIRVPRVCMHKLDVFDALQ